MNNAHQIKNFTHSFQAKNMKALLGVFKL